MSGVDRPFLLLAAVAALIGMFLGGSVHSGDYDLKPVHVHLLLFGWITNAIYGLFYAIFEDKSNTRTSWLHFIVASLAMILLPLGFYPFGGEMIEDLLWLGASFAMLSAMFFIWVVFSTLMGQPDKISVGQGQS